MKTWSLHINGQVQGVGFRPFISVLAKRMHLLGEVSNDINGVRIRFNAEDELCEIFTESVLQGCPKQAVISHHFLKEEPKSEFSDFRIIKGDVEGDINLMLTPDFAICEECKADISDIGNLRTDYAFTTCTNCGPRYSVINRLPYEREYTVMNQFQMCQSCLLEYNYSKDRRYYSQTNSCSDCGITMGILNSNGDHQTLNQLEVINGVISAWERGDIVAIKGIGGYLLTCDASNSKSIELLRARKRRPSKPFAIMYGDINELGGFKVSDKERIELMSSVAPIVLLEKKEGNSLSKNIAPNLNHIGVVLSYTPLYQLLLNKYKNPIIATSCNISNEPIIFDDSSLGKLFSLADWVLTNNRNIVTPQDDSVVKFSKHSQSRIVIRRSRGIAPSYIHGANLNSKNILSTGAMLKSTFTFQRNKNIYMSQYLGDLQSYSTELNYCHALTHLESLFKFHPDIVLSDKHGDYPSSRIAKEQALKYKSKLINIQHHKAHFTSVLGEHDLIDIKEPILGVVWDGMGTGDDEHIWGGEFFRYEDYKIERCNHFNYFPSILRDKMAKEPRVAALALSRSCVDLERIVESKFTSQEWTIYEQLLSSPVKLLTSSVGRIFDAVASLLGLGDLQSYEGEVAMLLEQLAAEYFDHHEFASIEGYLLLDDDSMSTEVIMNGIVKDVTSGYNSSYIAAKFHYTLVQIIEVEAKRQNVSLIACSGGVFQNGLLVDLLKHFLAPDYTLYLNKELSPNDENISFGQVMYYHIEERRLKREANEEMLKATIGTN